MALFCKKSSAFSIMVKTRKYKNSVTYLKYCTADTGGYGAWYSNFEIKIFNYYWGWSSCVHIKNYCYGRFLGVKMAVSSEIEVK